MGPRRSPSKIGRSEPKVFVRRRIEDSLDAVRSCRCRPSHQPYQAPARSYCRRRRLPALEVGAERALRFVPVVFVPAVFTLLTWM